MRENFSRFGTQIIILMGLAIRVNCSFQPLELDEPITLTAQYDAYILSYPVSRISQKTVLFCFSPRSLVTSSATSNIHSTTGEIKKCHFEKQSSQYFCIYLYSSNNVFSTDVFRMAVDQNNIWTADTNIQRWWEAVASTKLSPNMTKQQNQSQANPNAFVSSPIQTSNTTNTNNTPNASVQSYAFVQNIVITNYFANDSFYHMLTCPQYNNETGSCQQMWKQNYVQTFKHLEKKINLIVQRRHYCGIFKQLNQEITNHIFYGGVLRQGNYHMFFAVLNYLSNKSQVLNMWGGISYSYDHANRDMFCYATDGSNFDATSLIAGALYKDIASNINGKQNIEIVDSFYSDKQEKKYMYFIQYHRLYNTDDRLGDQRLFRKIYDRFAFAARFEYVGSANNTIINTPSCLKQQHYHNFLMSFIADVSVYEQRLCWVVAFMICILFNI